MCVCVGGSLTKLTTNSNTHKEAMGGDWDRQKDKLSLGAILLDDACCCPSEDKCLNIVVLLSLLSSSNEVFLVQQRPRVSTHVYYNCLIQTVFKGTTSPQRSRTGVFSCVSHLIRLDFRGPDPGSAHAASLYIKLHYQSTNRTL